MFCDMAAIMHVITSDAASYRHSMQAVDAQLLADVPPGCKCSMLS